MHSASFHMPIPPERIFGSISPLIFLPRIETYFHPQLARHYREARKEFHQ